MRQFRKNKIISQAVDEGGEIIKKNGFAGVRALMISGTRRPNPYSFLKKGGKRFFLSGYAQPGFKSFDDDC